MGNDQLDDRRDLACRRLGTMTPACTVAGCAERDPLALVGTDPNIRCYDHDLIARGRPSVVGQHTAGRVNHSVTVPLPGNDHRVIDPLKGDWPKATRDNPDGSIVLAAAGCLRGWLDTMLVIIDRTCGWIPRLLELLHVWLCLKLGDGWPAEFRSWLSEQDYDGRWSGLPEGIRP
jgi:hypothetical protein